MTTKDIKQLVEEIVNILDGSLLKQYKEQVEEELTDLKMSNQALRDSLWTNHMTHKKDKYDLPVPRLQMRVLCGQELENEDNHVEWHYELVYKHLLDDIISIPLGRTSSRAGYREEPPVDEDRKIQLPYRDGAHIFHDMNHLNLPTYVIYRDLVNKLKPGTEPADRNEDCAIEEIFIMKD